MAGVITSVFAATLAPVTSRAEVNGDTGKAIQIGGGIENQDYLYYGYYNDHPVKWRVLDAKSTNTGAKRMFLLSEYLLGEGGIQYSNDTSSNVDANK